MANILQSAGSQDPKGSRYAAIYNSRFFTGLWLQRNPLSSPGTRVENIYYGGRPEAIISGVNVELTNLLTLARRYGSSAYSLQTVSEAINSFYSFKSFTATSETIQVMMDGLTQIYTISPAMVSTVFTKANGAGQTSFFGVNNWLYFGDGAEERAWNGTGNTRKWGIATAGISLTSAYAGTGASNSTGAISASQGPKSPNTEVDSGVAGPTGSKPWVAPTNSQVLDGIFTSSQLTAVDNGSGGITQDGTTYLKVTNFSFMIPAGATVTGVAATIYREDTTSGTLYPAQVQDDAVYLVKAGTIQSGGTNHASGNAWPLGYVTSNSYGTSSDLWGGAYTPTDINSSGFGLAIAAKINATQLRPATGLNTRTAAIDYISIAVYYTVPGTASWTNPTNVQGAPNAAYTTAIPVGDVQTAALLATNYSFAVSGTITGVQVNVTGHVSATAGDTVIYAQLQDNNGNPIGIQKQLLVPSTSDVILSFGSGTDTWGATLTTGIINTASFGVQIIVSGNGQTFSTDAAQIQVSAAGITATVSGSAGTFTAASGYQYGYAYGNTSVSPPVYSNMTPASTTTGAFTNKLNVGVTVVASTDTQVNTIWVFRTKDGGATFYSLPTNPYPNTSTTITDTAADSTLNQFQLPAQSNQNTPPPAGIGGMVFHMGRLWGFLSNTLYYATGPDLGNILGNPYESWSPANVFTFPSKISKLIPTSVGLLVFTISDVYIVYGTGSALAASTGVAGITVFYPAPFIQNLGLLSQFAADVNGTTIYLHSADKQCLQLDPSSGISKIGFPIGSANLAYPSDPNLSSFNPASSYVTWHAANQDEAVHISDGSTGWFRCNTSQAPDGGFVWSPKANIVGGCQAVQSIETTPGVHQLLIGPGTGGGSVLYRDTTVFTDKGTAYPANFIMGSIVLAYPGQIAELAFITCDYNKVGTAPVLSVLLNEVSGTFQNISGFTHSDPPILYGISGSPSTLFSTRYDFRQTAGGGAPLPAWARHMQVKIDFGSTDGVRNEIFTFTIVGAHHAEL